MESITLTISLPPIPFHRPSQAFFKIYFGFISEMLFRRREMSASECLISPPRSAPWMGEPEYEVSVCRSLKVSLSVIRRPVATLNTLPAACCAGALQASRLASTALSM